MSTQDVVAVLNASFEQVFPDAKALKLTVVRSSRAMEHPLETGATVTDHRIINPTTAELSIVCASADYRAVYQQIVDLFIRGELLTVQGRVDSFASMMIEKMPHDESPDVLDGVTVAISLKEAKFVEAQFSILPVTKVARPKDSDTSKRGQQEPTTPPKASILSSWFK